MTPRQRRWLFFAGIAIFLAFYLWGLKGLPGFGNYPGPYGFIINRIAVAQTHATGVVSAVNFEYRGFDTVGEEFILFVAATGVATVLRHMRGEREETASAVGAPERSGSPPCCSPVRPSSWAATSACTRRRARPADSRAGWCWPAHSS
jgi:hypothetical protein